MIAGRRWWLAAGRPLQLRLRESFSEDISIAARDGEPARRRREARCRHYQPAHRGTHYSSAEQRRVVVVYVGYEQSQAVTVSLSRHSDSACGPSMLRLWLAGGIAHARM